ncbi:MAG: hypothetical protein RIS44_3248 [Pseudomonadota bacterium]|jgi:hypothetical protein
MDAYGFQSSFYNPGTFADGVSYGESAPNVIGGGAVWGNVATPGYSPTFFGDTVESTRFDQFTPRAGQNDQRPWWERVAEYGLGRYIDNKWGPTAVNQTSQPGTFAGQNGRTYTNVPVQSGAAAAGMPNGLLLAAAAVAAFFFLLIIDSAHK